MTTVLKIIPDMICCVALKDTNLNQSGILSYTRKRKVSAASCSPVMLTNVIFLMKDTVLYKTNKSEKNLNVTFSRYRL